MYVADASVWVSRFVRGDVHHEPSRRWLAGRVAEGRAIEAPALLLPEVAGAIARRSGRPELATRAVSWERNSLALSVITASRRQPLDARSWATRLAREEVKRAKGVRGET